ncbi:MAG: SHOCT domain-containing protein [Rhodospirillales bacterium]|nr:SHOCT domain-containing protein [Rhodospirillales bacterium]
MLGHGMHGGFGGPFMMVLFFTALIVIAILLIKWLGGGHRYHRCTHRRSHSQGKAAEDVLRERFARGEIDKAEFEERLNVLKS